MHGCVVAISGSVSMPVDVATKSMAKMGLMHRGTCLHSPRRSMLKWLFVWTLDIYLHLNSQCFVYMQRKLQCRFPHTSTICIKCKKKLYNVSLTSLRKKWFCNVFHLQSMRQCSSVLGDCSSQHSYCGQHLSWFSWRSVVLKRCPLHFCPTDYVIICWKVPHWLQS